MVHSTSKNLSFDILTWVDEDILLGFFLHMRLPPPPVIMTIFGKVNLIKFILLVLILNALYPLAYVLLKKYVSCVSLRSFASQVTWLTKYSHD